MIEQAECLDEGRRGWVNRLRAGAPTILRPRRGSLLACVSAGVCVLGFAESAAPSDTVVTGKHFRVVCGVERQSLAEEALATAEAVWPRAVALYGGPADPPDKPLTIHLFRTADAYRKVATRLTDGRLNENLAFSSRKTRSSYIVLQPPCTAETLAVIGLPELTRRQIAHEAAHLVCYETAAHHQSRPLWLTEGAAMWLAETTLRKNGWSRGMEAAPFTATDIGRVRAALKSGRLPPVESILRDEYGELGFYEQYAVQWLFFRFMLTDAYKKRFKRIIRQAWTTGDSGDSNPLRVRMSEALGGPKFDSVDRKFRRYIRSLFPRWREVYRSLDTKGTSWTQVAFEDKNAIAWRTRPARRGRCTIMGSVEVLPNRKRQMNLLLGYDADGFISVAFTAGYGVNVYRYYSQEDQWDRLADRRIKGLEVGRKIRFMIDVADQKLTVRVGKHRLPPIDLGDKPMTGPWGVGAQAGSAGRWWSVRFGGRKREDPKAPDPEKVRHPGRPAGVDDRDESSRHPKR